MMNFYKFLFINLMFSSTLISISSTSWFNAWIGLEMNLLSIMPLMKSSNNKYSAEAMIKYFIIQTMASSILLFSILIYSNLKIFNTNSTHLFSILINSSLLMKMGAAPFHFWLPEVLSGLNWQMNFTILTWQKIAPMILLSYTILLPSFLSIIIILSSLISGIYGLNQNCLRKILAFSSINHMSWMISIIMNSLNTWMYYFLIYSIINMNIMFIFNKYQIYYIKQLNKLFTYNKTMKFIFMLNFLSLGGLPPFLGFFPKWMTIYFLINKSFFTLSFILIVFTMISLYFYLRITFPTFTLNSNESLIKTFNKINFLHFFTNFISLMGLMICFITSNFY
uniref:NADH-ubiquinone oxidoreductase chain 2 n=1 Tax=Eucryptorrhynchus scrobiculatus TaxID=1552824 RepID=A0A0D3QTZ9_EUCSC|nr:NADH dehydrogenase subunit 2 [Eucryptorrhynchus scrobiculatus]AJR19202.1 NADH dehydrogenase subunit 2 [Eucryptorrhynchus scrobiculatus]AJZ71907.1 NADH dehydrogenase subunit 2 [Eucryptorrhynchus scrobiculatus]UNO31858.1 NADH dehydrogenase subunit 2 [Eucryptorrhynchus scrobiculatus]